MTVVIDAVLTLVRTKFRASDAGCQRVGSQIFICPIYTQPQARGRDGNYANRKAGVPGYAHGRMAIRFLEERLSRPRLPKMRVDRKGGLQHEMQEPNRKRFRFHAAGPPFGQPSSLAADRKSTRLNSSHQIISYAVFCLK